MEMLTTSQKAHRICGRIGVVILLAAVGIGTAGCDTVEPVDSSTLVLEGYLNTDRPLPEIHVRRTLPPDGPYSNADASVTDAAVTLTIGEETVPYHAVDARPGTYEPARRNVGTTAGLAYRFRIRWDDAEIESQGVLPPAIQVRDIDLRIPDEPISAVFLDSLSLGDSLATGAYTGYIYPVEVVVKWDAARALDSWVRVQLRPYSTVSSTVIDLFLQSDEVILEESGADGMQTWTGVYAVGVPHADAAMPEHLLRVGLVRSGEDYARFASSKDDPNRREPISNLDGAAGILTAVSVDSMHVGVVHGGP